MLQARIDLSNTRLLSPVSGVILEREINPGETTRVDQGLIRIGVLDPVYMDAAVTEDKIAYVYLGMAADVQTDAFTGETFYGTVAKIDSTVDQTTRTFGVYVNLENRQLRFKKGVTGYVRLKGMRLAVAVPSTAVMNPQGDRPSVFVVDKSHRARMREVRTGLVSDGFTEIVSGVQEGESVVAVGQFDLRDSDAVLVNRFAPWNKS
jgi:RND family efflux transporter MFP subunit